MGRGRGRGMGQGMGRGRGQGMGRGRASLPALPRPTFSASLASVGSVTTETGMHSRVPRHSRMDVAVLCPVLRHARHLEEVGLYGLSVLHGFHGRTVAHGKVAVTKDR